MTQRNEEQGWGGDGLGPEDMAIAEIKLVQNVGGDMAKEAGAKPGNFYLSLSDEVIPEGFDMVIVSMQKNRTYWGRAEIMDEPPECASPDARSMLSLNGDDCKACERRCETPWLLTPDKRREMCLINYNIIGIKLPEEMPILVRTSGLSAQAAKELYTQLALNKQLAGSWYKAKTHVVSVKKKSSAGEAFAMKFGKLTPVGDEQLKEGLRIQSGQLLGTQVLLPVGREPEEELAPGITLTPTTPKLKTAPPASKAEPKTPKVEEPVEEPPAEPIDMSF